MHDVEPWSAVVIGPAFELLWRYEIKLHQRHLLRGSNTLEDEALWVSFEEVGIHVAWTRRGAERKARRLVARRNRRDRLEASPTVVHA